MRRPHGYLRHLRRVCLDHNPFCTMNKTKGEFERQSKSGGATQGRGTRSKYIINEYSKSK